ncbi:hypothetical protein [Methylomonas sp. HYX-M1]|uniref:deoxynucleotide monophosphate kinase family protein n=1 Tax=Methylomonas sp. HYX-M1 TaxID=3139307 RepID=UPI00345BD656
MIIGFTGRKQSGKSTAASALLSLGYRRHSFADPLRAMVDVLLSALGLTAAEIAACHASKEEVIYPIGVSMRHLLQTLGTDWGRRLINPDLWVMCEQARLEQLSADAHRVYDDVRFENEAALIRAHGGMIVHIQRPGLPDTDTHASEAGIAVAPGDIVLDNCGNLGLLLDAVLALAGD